MKNGNSKKIAAVIAAVVVAAAGFIFAPSIASGQSGSGSGTVMETPLFSVRTAASEKRTLRAFLEVNGDITSSQEAEVFPDTTGKLVKVNVALGARVRKGDVIAEVDPSKPGASYMNSPVYAPISGIVSRTPLSVGTQVSQGTGITTVSVTSNLEISARIPEREIAGLKTGLKAEVTLQAYPGEVFTATVTRIAPMLDSASRTKRITLAFDKEDSRVNAGMFARVRINTRTYDDALTVPAEAVVKRHGEDMVFVSRQNALETPSAEARPVSAGVTIDGWTEIKDGLAEGEAVIVQGQQLLNGGEPVRVAARRGK